MVLGNGYKQSEMAGECLEWALAIRNEQEWVGIGVYVSEIEVVVVDERLLLNTSGGVRKRVLALNND